MALAETEEETTPPVADPNDPRKDLTEAEKEQTKDWDLDKVDIKKDEDGKVVPVPKGFTPSDVDGEKKIDTGFVIKQDGTENEFVWVPIVSGYEFGKLYDFGTASAPKNELMSLTEDSYKKGYHEPDILTNTEYGDASTESNRGINLLKSVIGLSGTNEQILEVWKTQIESEYNTMVASGNKYGGFYIGRYETGFEDSTKATVRKNNAPENLANQNWYQIYQKSKNLAKGLAIESTMIWGSQWDATMQWFLSSSDSDTVKYVRDSTGKGNYKGTQGSSNVAIPTGSNASYKVNNIYDMAGNCSEWTLEADFDEQRTLRSSCYGDTGTVHTVSNRATSGNFDWPFSKAGSRSSRVTLVL